MGQTPDWQSCVVRIDVDEEPSGTGCFVAEGLVLTCRHVVEDETDLSVVWQGDRHPIAQVQIPDKNVDLALLSVDLPNHNWTILDDDIVDFEQFKAFGFPENYPNGDPLTLEFEGFTGGNLSLIKLKAGQVEPGYSGAPLVNARTNKVCGVVKSTRDEDYALGGRAVPISLVWDLFPELRPQVTEIHENPFKPINGVINSPELFFGRERELRNVFEILNSGSSVAVIGDRQIGKSSFLKAIAHHAERQLVKYRRPVYLNFQDIYDDEDFYYALCSEINIETCRGYRLRRTISKLDPPILLLLDEVEKMKWEGFTLQIRSQLRGLAEGSDAPLRLVVAASMDLDMLFPDSKGNVSPFKNICLNESLSLWDEALVQQFILGRLALTSIRFTDQEIMQILVQTQGHPQKVMEACFRLYNRYKEQGTFNI